MARPTVSIGAKITANSTSSSPPATARGVFLFACLQPTAETATATHAMTGVQFGGIALTSAGVPGFNSGHMCGWYLEDYAAWRRRTSNVFTFTGGAMGTVASTYSAWPIWILHPTHTVDASSVASNAAEVTTGNNLQATPLTSGDVVSAIAFLCSNGATSAPRASQTAILSSSAIFVKEVSASWRNVTGNVAVGYDVSATTGFNRCALIAMTWKESLPLSKSQGNRVWALGSLPALPLPMLRAGLVAARSIPVGARV